MRLFRLDPQQVCTVLQRGDGVEDAAVFTGARLELVQVGRQTLRAHQLAIALDHDIAWRQIVCRDFFTVEESVVLVAQIARLVGESDLLGQASTQAVRAGDDNAVLNTKLHEGIAAGADFRDEVFMRNRDFTVLVAALFLVGDLVFDLKGAGAGFDHLFRQQIRGFRVTEARVDVGDDRNNMGFVIVDLSQHALLFDHVAFFARGVEVTEQHAEFAGVGLLQEGVELFNQGRDRGLLVHGLIRKRTEVGAKRCDHPAGEVEVFALRASEVLLDRNQLLLTDETVPATQRLRVCGRIGVVSRHVLAHDFCRVTGDIEAGMKTVLSPHTSDRFRVNTVPSTAKAIDPILHGLNVVLVTHWSNSVS